VVLGDFNLNPEEPELQPFLALFKDAWRAASDARSAIGTSGTHGEKRIDYIFFKGDSLELTAAQTVETASWFGKAASDHRPLVATFRQAHVVKSPRN
jgi:endonuclease/exonuclease/phosphatase family metal-dependent hydrolase